MARRRVLRKYSKQRATSPAVPRVRDGGPDMATIVIETDDGIRVKVMRVKSRAEYLSREDKIRVAVYRALECDALVTGKPVTSISIR